MYTLCICLHSVFMFIIRLFLLFMCIVHLCTFFIYVHCAFWYNVYIDMHLICTNSVLCVGVHCTLYSCVLNIVQQWSESEGWSRSGHTLSGLVTVDGQPDEDSSCIFLRNCVKCSFELYSCHARQTLWRPSTYQFFHLSHKLHLTMRSFKMYSWHASQVNPMKTGTNQFLYLSRKMCDVS